MRFGVFVVNRSDFTVTFVDSVTSSDFILCRSFFCSNPACVCMEALRQRRVCFKALSAALMFHHHPCRRTGCVAQRAAPLQHLCGASREPRQSGAAAGTVCAFCVMPTPHCVFVVSLEFSEEYSVCLCHQKAGLSCFSCIFRAQQGLKCEFLVASS